MHSHHAATKRRLASPPLLLNTFRSSSAYCQLLSGTERSALLISASGCTGYLPRVLLFGAWLSTGGLTYGLGLLGSVACVLTVAAVPDAPFAGASSGAREMAGGKAFSRSTRLKL